MNFTDDDGLDLTYYGIDFFGDPSEKVDHLINDENANINWCYFIYQIIYYYVLYLYLIITFSFILLFTLCLFLILVVYKIYVLFGLKMNEDDVCLVDCATIHTILWDKRYFLELTLIKVNVSIISSITNLVGGYGKANIILSNRTRLHINYALYSSKSRKNLLSFKYIHKNGYHIEIMN